MNNKYYNFLKNHLDKLYEECKHGDEEHQKWLKDKFENYLKSIK